MQAIPRNRLLSASIAVVALGAALVAPLATSSSQPADAVTIAGARSLSDHLSVQFAKPKPGHKTTVAHVLAYNDFHGSLEAASLNLYGQFAGGAAYLAKAIKDRQRQYGKAHEATVFAGDNIGASPLANGLFHEEPATIVANLMHADFASVGNHEFDKGWHELLRIQNGGCHADGCTGAPYALANGGDNEPLPRRRLPVPVGQRHRRRHRQAAVPGVRRSSRLTRRQGNEVRVGFIGEVLKDTPDDRDADRRRGPHVHRTRRRGQPGRRRAAGQGRQGSDPRDPPGRRSSPGPAALNGCAGNLAGSPIEAIAQQLDPSIKVIISAHTHAEYRCTITTPTERPGSSRARRRSVGCCPTSR